MNLTLQILITLVLGFTGGYFGKKLKLPVGGMTGALIFVIACKLLTDAGYLPRDSKTILQIFSGALIGSRVMKSDVVALKNLWRAALLLIVGMILLNICSAFLMNTSSALDFQTAFFSSAPGGLQDMALIAPEFDADPVIVSICQICRVLYILTIIPSLYRWIYVKCLYPRAFRKEIPSTKGSRQTQSGKSPKGGANSKEKICCRLRIYILHIEKTIVCYYRI